MKRGVSLVELVFVLVIVGILSGAALYSFKPRYLQDEANYLLMKILEAKYQGINYDKRLATPDTNRSIGCIELTKEALKASYKFHSQIAQDFGVLCFDRYGRGWKGNRELQKTTLVELRYGKKRATLILLPQSGYVIIDYNKM